MLATYVSPLVVSLATYTPSLIVLPPSVAAFLDYGGEAQSFVIPAAPPASTPSSGSAVYTEPLSVSSATYVEPIDVSTPPVNDSLSYGGESTVLVTADSWQPSGGTGHGGRVAPDYASQIREAVLARLTQFIAITLDAGPRIYFGGLPQTCKIDDGPAITFFIADRPYGHVLAGCDGTSTAHVRISALGYIESDVDQIGQAVRDAFDGWRGVASGVQITACRLRDERDFPQAPRTGTDQWVYQVTQHYELDHRVDRPTLLGV